MGRAVAVWPKRPFKITYFLDSWKKVGRRVACSSPEAVVRSTALTVIGGRADIATVTFDGELFATMARVEGDKIYFQVR